jgi:hypothetical protein
VQLFSISQNWDQQVVLQLGLVSIEYYFLSDCRTNKLYVFNETAACSCWSQATGGTYSYFAFTLTSSHLGMALAKTFECNTFSIKTAASIKSSMNKCLDAFRICKKAEDAAAGLIHTCLLGKVALDLSFL